MRVGLWVMACNYLLGGLSLGINLYLARQLGEHGYGVFSFAVLTATVAFTLGAFGAERTLVRDLVQSSQPAAVMSASLRLRMLTTLTVAVGGAGWIAWKADLPGGPLVAGLGLAYGLMMALLPAAWFDSRREMHKASLLQLSEKMLFAAGVAVLLGWAGSTAAVAAVLCAVVARLLNLTIQWAIVSRSCPLRPLGPETDHEFSGLWRENRLICLAAIANLSITHFSQMLLSGQGAAALGQYALAFQIIMLVQIAQTQLTRLLGPRIDQATSAEAAPGAARRQFAPLLLVAAGISLLLTVPVFVGVPWALNLFLPGRFADVGPSLRILCGWSLIYGVGLVVNRFLLGLRLSGAYFWVTFSSGLLSAALSLNLVPTLGGVGAALSLVLTHSVSILIQAVLVLWRASHGAGEAEDVEPRRSRAA